MQLGFIGSGNMARSLALALAEPALHCDSGSGRATALAELTGGEATTLAEVARRSDVLLLCHKPAQLDAIAAQIKDFDGIAISVLAATDLARLRQALPAATLVRTMPNIPVEQGQGVLAVAAESDPASQLEPLLKRCGLVISVPEAQFEVVTAVSGCAPAFFARFARALIDAAVERGMDLETATAVVTQTLLGTGTTLLQPEWDAAGLERAVASPGGLTERALESFEQNGLPGIVERAVATVLDR